LQKQTKQKQLSNLGKCKIDLNYLIAAGVILMVSLIHISRYVNLVMLSYVGEFWN